MQRFFVEPHQIDRERHEIHITGSDVNHIVERAPHEKRRGALDQRQGERISLCDRKCWGG